MDPNKTVMGSPMTLNATQTIKPVQCPICKSRNPAGVIFCNECGLIFDRALPGDAFSAPAVQLPVLVDESGREYPIRPGENVVGREGDILITDTGVSRRHACITLDGSNLSLLDLGSSNGTLLNSKRIASGSTAPLSEGDTISFGEFQAKLSLPGTSNSTQVLHSNKTAAISGPPVVEVAPGTLEGSDMSFALKKGANSFGRKADNDVTITDPYVSGKHGIIELAEDGIFLTDVGSSNGTLLNDAKLTPNMRTLITGDDEIRLGSLVFRVKVTS